VPSSGIRDGGSELGFKNGAFLHNEWLEGPLWPPEPHAKCWRRRSPWDRDRISSTCVHILRWILRHNTTKNSTLPREVPDRSVLADIEYPRDITISSSTGRVSADQASSANVYRCPHDAITLTSCASNRHWNGLATSRKSFRALFAKAGLFLRQANCSALRRHE